MKFCDINLPVEDLEAASVHPAPPLLPLPPKHLLRPLFEVAVLVAPFGRVPLGLVEGVEAAGAAGAVQGRAHHRVDHVRAGALLFVVDNVQRFAERGEEQPVHERVRGVRGAMALLHRGGRAEEEDRKYAL